MNSSLQQCWEHFKKLHWEIEERVQERPGSYRSLPTEALYTSPEDLYALFHHPLIQGSFVDLGCGTGFTVLMYGSLFPERKAIGIEFEEARLLPGTEYLSRLKEENISLLHQDLLTCVIPEADSYFLYFPTGLVLDRILSTLYSSQKEFHLIVIESHGDLIARIELENWLVCQDEVELRSFRHYPKAKIYKRQFKERSPDLLPFDCSFRDMFLLLEKNGESWVGETFGMEWSKEDRFELQTPPRTIFWNDVKKLMVLSEFDEKIQRALELRKLGELKIMTRDGCHQGFIRKIILTPTFQVEISSGAKVEWEDILTIGQGSQTCYESFSSF